MPLRRRQELYHGPPPLCKSVFPGRTGENGLKLYRTEEKPPQKPWNQPYLRTLSVDAADGFC